MTIRPIALLPMMATVLLAGCNQAHLGLISGGTDKFKTGIESANTVVADYYDSVREQRRMTGTYNYILYGKSESNIDAEKFDESFANFVCAGSDVAQTEPAALAAAAGFAKALGDIAKAPEADVNVGKRFSTIRNIHNQEIPVLKIETPGTLEAFKECTQRVRSDLKNASTELVPSKPEGLFSTAAALFTAFEAVKALYQAADKAVSLAGAEIEAAVRAKKAKAFVGSVKSAIIDPNADKFDAAAACNADAEAAKTAGTAVPVTIDSILYCRIDTKNLTTLHDTRRGAALAIPAVMFKSMLLIDREKQPDKVLATAQKTHLALAAYDTLSSSQAPKPDKFLKAAREAWKDLRRYEEGMLTLEEWFTVMSGYKDAFDNLMKSWEDLKKAEDDARTAIGGLAKTLN